MTSNQDRCVCVCACVCQCGGVSPRILCYLIFLHVMSKV